MARRVPKSKQQRDASHHFSRRVLLLHHHPPTHHHSNNVANCCVRVCVRADHVHYSNNTTLYSSTARATAQHVEQVASSLWLAGTRTRHRHHSVGQLLLRTAQPGRLERPSQRMALAAHSHQLHDHGDRERKRARGLFVGRAIDHTTWPLRPIRRPGRIAPRRRHRVARRARCDSKRRISPPASRHALGYLCITTCRYL